MPAPAPPAPAAQLLTVQEEWAGQRLDNYLFRTLKGVPKSHVYRLIRSGQVRVNKSRAQADSRLAAGDLVRLPPVRTSTNAADATNAPTPSAPARDFAVLFEDELLLAIDKPAGVAVHGGSGVSFGVIEQLRAARPQARFLELVHRLDKETSGILLIAKRRSALTHLQDQFRARSTGKTYLALVKGTWPQRRKTIDTPLRKYLLPDGERRVRPTSKDDPDAMAALSLIHARQSWPAQPERGLPATSLLEVTIKTGRTHQIRVHTASSGHPIAGDEKYGDFDWNKRLARQGLARMYLHAWHLRFAHPKSGQTVALQSLPGDWPSEWLAGLADSADLAEPAGQPKPAD